VDLCHSNVMGAADVEILLLISPFSSFSRSCTGEVDAGSFRTPFWSALPSLVILVNGGRYWTSLPDNWSTPFPGIKIWHFLQNLNWFDLSHLSVLLALA
jgi:hypothetical protein